MFRGCLNNKIQPVQVLWHVSYCSRTFTYNPCAPIHSPCRATALCFSIKADESVSKYIRYLKIIRYDLVALLPKCYNTVVLLGCWEKIWRFQITHYYDFCFSVWKKCIFTVFPFTTTAWKVSKYGIFTGPYLDTFHNVYIVNFIVRDIFISSWNQEIRHYASNQERERERERERESVRACAVFW